MRACHVASQRDNTIFIYSNIYVYENAAGRRRDAVRRINIMQQPSYAADEYHCTKTVESFRPGFDFCRKETKRCRFQPDDTNKSVRSFLNRSAIEHRREINPDYNLRLERRRRRIGAGTGRYVRKLLQALLWISEGVYIIWVFLLPYAPGDPLWAISSETINSLIGLSLNFFFILPLSNSVGFHLIEAPVLHPMSEGLFNFVIGWTFMFAPLLFTDKMRSRFKGSIDVLWGFQMFLTNTFLIPYMAIRLNEPDEEYTTRKTSQLGSVMINKAAVVGLVGGFACLFSVLWALYGRGDGNYGDLRERWEFLISYIGSERLAYAFIWDICLYLIFQPWLIGDNLENLENDKIGLVRIVRFVPVVVLIAYCLCLNSKSEK